jgi:hypothetical protein
MSIAILDRQHTTRLSQVYSYLTEKSLEDFCLRGLVSKRFEYVLVSGEVNKLRVLTILILCRLLRTTSVLDLPYRKSDKIDLSIAQKIKYDLVDFLNFRLAHRVLLETHYQINRVWNKFHLYPFYALGAKERSPVMHTSSEPNSAYLLRAMPNRDLGVEYILSQFEKVNKSKTASLIWVAGRKKAEALDILKKRYGDVWPTWLKIEGYLDPKSLESVIINCRAMIGQWGLTYRMRYTVPYRFFEALTYKKKYLSLNYLPLSYLGYRSGSVSLAQQLHDDLDGKDASYSIRDILTKVLELNSSTIQKVFS